MQMLYNSDSFVVVHFSLSDEAEALHPGRGGFEIVDKLARKEIYLQGAVAESFQPRNRSWARPSGPRCGALARRDDAAG